MHLDFLSWDERTHVCTPLLSLSCMDSAPGSAQWPQAAADLYTPFLLCRFFFLLSESNLAPHMGFFRNC